VLLVNGNKRVRKLFFVGVGNMRKVGAIALSGYLSDLAEGHNGTANDRAGFRVGNVGLNLDQTGEELGNEGSDGDMGIDELGHIVDNAKK
jgi:hypothetical protein